jgi:DNA-binding NarL/FixJ family response regulator
MITVAIIEDDLITRESLELLLQASEDLEMTGSFPDGESGVEFLKEQPADIVLVDIHLPGISGIECVRKLKAIHPQMKFIMCTIFKDDESVFTALKAGANGYLLKNDDPARITDSIRDLHSGGAPMTPEIARRVLESFQEPRGNEETDHLTKREKEMLGMLAKGLRYKEIADILFISPTTVRTHIYNIYQKLHVQSRMEAVNKIFGTRG